MLAVLPPVTKRSIKGLVYTKRGKFHLQSYFQDGRTLGFPALVAGGMMLSVVRASCFADHRLYITTATIVPQIKATATSEATLTTITMVKES